MGYEKPLESLGFYPADIDMSTTGVWQFAAVWIGPAQNVQGHGFGGAALQAQGSNTNPPLGILQNNPVQTEAGAVMTLGVSKCIAGGTFTVGDPLAANSAGALIKAAAGSFAIGRALESAVAGDISTIQLYPLGKQ